MAFQVTTSAAGAPQLWIYGEIGREVFPQDVAEALKTIPDKQAIEVLVHSPGGSYTDSINIHSQLSRRKGRVDVLVQGLAASGGSVIAQAGKSIRIAEGSWMMLHEAHGSVSDARADDFRDYATQLDQINSQLVNIYKKRWKGGDEKALRAVLAAETWFSEADSVTNGLADSIDEGMRIAAYKDPSTFGYRNIPEIILSAKEEPKPDPRAEILAELFADKNDAEEAA